MTTTWRAEYPFGTGLISRELSARRSSHPAPLIAGFNVAEFWNGSSWRLLDPVGAGGGLADVSCASPTRCMAAGSAPAGQVGEHTLAERWRGSRWRLLATPNP